MTQIAERRHEISFYLRRCIKYHTYRSAFFAKLKTIMSFVGVLFGTAVAAALVAKLPPIYAISASIIVAGFSAFDLVVGTAKRSWDHNDLKKRFFVVEIDFLEVDPESFDDKMIREFESRIRKIESDEPYGLQFLNAVAENEVIRSMYPAEDASKYVSKLPWHKRATANMIDWDISEYIAVKA
jgi:hypothetical protein